VGLRCALKVSPQPGNIARPKHDCVCVVRQHGRPGCKRGGAGKHPCKHRFGSGATGQNLKRTLDRVQGSVCRLFDPDPSLATAIRPASESLHRRRSVLKTVVLAITRLRYSRQRPLVQVLVQVLVLSHLKHPLQVPDEAPRCCIA